MTERTMIRSLVSGGATLLTLIAFARASAPQPEGLPRFEPDTSAVEVTDDLQWLVTFRVENRLSVGIYLDSLICEVQDLDPGETGAERSTVLDVSPVARVVESVSAGDIARFQYSGPALAEHARLTFRLALHRADGTRHALSTVVEALPGATSRQHPSQFVEANGRRVEYVLFPAGRDSAPGLLLVHDHGGNARKMLRTAQGLVARGYSVMLVSMPGYGQSEGPPDFMGPATVQALSAALDKLEAAHGVDAKRLAAWGISRGAGPVARLAQKRADLAAAIAQSGIYDLWAAYRGTKVPRLRQSIVSEAGSDSVAWRERSAASSPARPAAALLILHGEKDLDVPVEQARGFAEALKARGAEVELRLFPNAEHRLPSRDATGAALDFLKRRLGG